MYKSVLNGIKIKDYPEAENFNDLVVSDGSVSNSEDTKSNSPIGESIMDYVNKNHDFSKFSEDDLDDAIILLRRRCPKSWNKLLEDRAKAFHKKILTMR